MILGHYQKSDKATSLFYIIDLLIINFVAYFLPINLQENFLFHAIFPCAGLPFP